MEKYPHKHIHNVNITGDIDSESAHNELLEKGSILLMSKNTQVINCCCWNLKSVVTCVFRTLFLNLLSKDTAVLLKKIESQYHQLF